MTKNNDKKFLELTKRLLKTESLEERVKLYHELEKLTKK